MKMKNTFAAIATSATIGLAGCSATGGGGLIDQFASIPLVNEMTGIKQFQQAGHILQLAKTPSNLNLDGTLSVLVTVESVDVVEVEAGSKNTFAAYGETAKGLNETYREVAIAKDPIGVSETAGEIDSAIAIGASLLSAFSEKEMVEATQYTLVTEDGYSFTMVQPTDVSDVYAEGEALVYRSMSRLDDKNNLFYVEQAKNLASN